MEVGQRPKQVWFHLLFIFLATLKRKKNPELFPDENVRSCPDVGVLFGINSFLPKAVLVRAEIRVMGSFVVDLEYILAGPCTNLQCSGYDCSVEWGLSHNLSAAATAVYLVSLRSQGLDRGEATGQGDWVTP